MPLSEQIAKFQAEYERLEKVGREVFSPKAIQAYQKQLATELKKKLGDISVQNDEFRKQKGAVAAKLRELKEQRRQELMAAVREGTHPAEEAGDELMAMGFTPEQIKRDIGAATGARPPSTVGPDAAAAAPDPAPVVEPAPEEQPVEHQKIVDPITADRSDVQLENFKDTSRDDSKPAAEPQLIEDPITTERRKQGKPLRKK